MPQNILLCISLLIAIAAIAAIIARIIKQPTIIAYLISGILAGPLFFNIINPGSSGIIQILAHIGVALLLFIVGLSLDIRLLKEVGVVSVFAGIIGMLITGAAGFLISSALGFSAIASVYIALAISFSSTVVAVKILSDKKEIDTLHGRIALGVLIIQDFAAAIALMAIPLLGSSGSISAIAFQLGLVLALIAIVFIFATFGLNYFLNYLARSPEALFLFGLAWALILAAIFSQLGFSLEIGALIAGMSLASSKYTLEISGKVKPLRDFFVVLFFIFFGSQLSGSITFSLIKISLIFSLFILIGKPLLTMIILKLFGYKKRTNFLAGISLAHISEFSLILVLLGFSLGYLSQEIMNLAILIAIITIAISSYGIYYSGSIFNKLSSLLNIFEGTGIEKQLASPKKYNIILFGYHRIGYKILKSLKKLNSSFVVVDYNPKVILSLAKEKINCIFGDAGDKEFLNNIDLKNAKLIISTIPDENSNLSIIEKLNETNSCTAFIATAEHSKDALNLYNKGADFVLVPQHLCGNYASQMIESFLLEKNKYKTEGKKHFKEILEGKKNSIF